MGDHERARIAAREILRICAQFDGGADRCRARALADRRRHVPRGDRRAGAGPGDLPRHGRARLGAADLLERAESERLRGDEDARQRELREAHRPCTEIDAIRAADVAKELGC